MLPIPPPEPDEPSRRSQEPTDANAAGEEATPTEERKCARCGTSMEEGVLYGPESVSDSQLPTFFQQVGWMSGNQLKRERPAAWIFKGGIVNQRRKIIAWRCTSCDAVELTAALSSQDIRVGDVYNGRVTSIEHFGAFVELLPGRQGLCHISELDDRYVRKVEEVVSVGDGIQVKVVGIDAHGNIKLSRKAALREQP